SLDFLGSLFQRVALFVIRKGVMTGWDARGDWQPDRLRTAPIPIDAPSLAREVVVTPTPYRGEPAADVFGQLLRSALVELREQVLLAPLAIRDRVVGILYADSPRESVPDGVLERIAVEAGAAYERIVLTGSRRE